MQKIHLLVVDDEWNMRNLLHIYLTKNGFQVTEVNNGHEALKLVEMYFLADHPNRAITKEVLLEQVWSPDYYGNIRTMDTHVKNIREKARKADLSYIPIQTVWGVGYKFHDVEAK